MSDAPTPTQSPERSRANGGEADVPAAAAGKSTGSRAAQPPNAADAEMLARAQAGDHHAFAQLYALHKRRIYSLCLRMVGSVAEAEDRSEEHTSELQSL